MTRPTQSLARRLAKKGAVTAIVLDHEQPHEKAGGRNGEQQGSPGIAKVEREPGRGPQHHERQSRDRQLGNAAQPAWGAVVAQNARPTPGVEGVIPGNRRLNGGRLNGEGLNETSALLRVRALHSFVMHRDIPF